MMRQQNNRSKRKPTLLWIAVILLLAAGAAAGSSYLVHAGDDPDRQDTVAYVNGEPVAYGELVHEMEAYRSTVHAYFQDKYGAQDHEGYWTTSYGGEIPGDKLKELALDGSVRRKVLQLAGKAYGLVDDISYKRLLQDWKETNADRQEKVKNNIVIYGPVTYDEQRYINEASLALKRDLKEKLREELRVSEQEAASYYEANRERFGLGDSRTIRAIEVAFTGEADRKEREAAATAKLEGIRKRMDSGTPFGEIYEELAGGKDELLVVSEKVYDHTVPRTEAIRNPVLLGAIHRLQAGQVTGIVEQEHSMGIYACIDLHASGYSPISEVKPLILNALAEQKLDEWLEQRVKEAEVVVVKEHMDKVRMR